MTEVASAYVTLLPSLRDFGPNVRKQILPSLDRAGKEGGGRFAKGFGANLGGVKAALAGLGGGLAVGGFLRGAIRQASDLSETVAAVNVVFGSASAAVRDYANDSRKNILLTKQAALSAAQTFGTLGKAAGLSGKDLGKFSTDFVGLASDLASFNNTTPEAAVDALGAALRGEAEPIRKYGVLINDATLRQEALGLGLIKTTKQALTPQVRTLAIQASIWKQTKDAQGDAERTQNSYANQMRKLSKQMTDFKTSIGNAVLPTVTRLAVYLNGTVVPSLKSVKDFVKENSTTFKILGGIAASLTAGLLVYTGTVRVVTGVTKAWTAVQKVLNGTMRLNPIGLVVTALAALAVGMVYAYKKSDTFRSVLQRVFVAVVDSAGNMVSLVVRGFRGLLNVWLTVAGGIVAGAATALGWIPGLGGKLKKANAAFKTMKADILGTLDTLADKAANAGENVARGLVRGINKRRQTVFKAGQALGSTALAGVKSKGGLWMSSPSRAMAVVGRQAVDGLVVGLKARRKAVQAAMLLIAADIKKIGQRIAALRDVRGGLMDKARGIADGVRQFGDPIAAFGASGGGTKGLVASLTARLNIIKRFAAKMAALTKRGLNKAFLDNLYAAGPDQIGLVDTLAGASARDFATINSLNTQINRFANRTGTQAVAVDMQATNTLLTANQQELKVLNAKVARLAKEIAAETTHSKRKASAR